MLDPEATHTTRKKNKETTVKLKDIRDLRSAPICLKDGDHLGICGGAADDDDYQTAADEELRKEFEIRKKEQAEQRKKDQMSKNKLGDSASVKIDLIDDPLPEVLAQIEAFEKAEAEKRQAALVEEESKE